MLNNILLVIFSLVGTIFFGFLALYPWGDKVEKTFLWCNVALYGGSLIYISLKLLGVVT